MLCWGGLQGRPPSVDSCFSLSPDMPRANTPDASSGLAADAGQVRCLIPFPNHPCTLSASLGVRLYCLRFTFAFTNDLETEDAFKCPVSSGASVAQMQVKRLSELAYQDRLEEPMNRVNEIMLPYVPTPWERWRSDHSIGAHSPAKIGSHLAKADSTCFRSNGSSCQKPMVPLAHGTNTIPQQMPDNDCRRFPNSQTVGQFLAVLGVSI